MPTSSHLPARFPAGSKYVVEGRGRFVHRYVEFPNGRRLQLATRKAVSCRCGEREKINIVPDPNADVIDAPAFRRRIFA